MKIKQLQEAGHAAVALAMVVFAGSSAWSAQESVASRLMKEAGVSEWSKVETAAGRAIQDVALVSLDPEAGISAGKSVLLYCNEAKQRLEKGMRNNFTDMDIILTGKNIGIANAHFTYSLANTVKQGIIYQEQFLEKGVDYDGKPLSNEARFKETAHLGQMKKILAVGTGEGFEFEGEIKPYVRQPKRPTIQYPLALKTPFIKEDVLWDLLGNEGTGARVLLQPNMITGMDKRGRKVGHAGQLDIEFEGTQGPGWDRYDCR